MRRIFLSVTLLLMLLTATAFAEEPAEQSAEPSTEQPAGQQNLEQLTEDVFGKQDFDQPDEIYVHTSEDFKYTITCPMKPLAVVQNPWQDPARRGEMLVFDADGFNVRYAYYICVNEWDPEDESIPDFNHGSVPAIGEYLKALRTNGGFAVANLVNISKTNKGVCAVTAERIEVTNPETGEVEGELVADRQDIYTYFRTPQGRCISIQLVSVDLNKTFVNTYRGSVASFVDNSDKKSKKDKDKKSKKDKDKKDKKDKDKKDKDKK